MVEKAGRRKFLILGATGQCICYILIPGFLSQSNTPKDGFELGGALTAFFFLYYAFFAMCWQVCFQFPLTNIHVMEAQYFPFYREFLGYTHRKSMV